MRRTTAVVHAPRSLPLPRGWFILAGALASWALFAALWSGTSQLFSFVLHSI